MDKPCEIKAHLLSIVVFDDIKRLHVVEEARRQHARNKSIAIVHPTAIDLVSFGHVNRKMLQDNISFHQVFKLKISVQSLSNDLLLLTCIKSDEFTACKIYKRQLAIVVLESHFNFEFFSHHVYFRVVEEQNDCDAILFHSFFFSKVFCVLDSIVDSVIDAFLLNERL